MSRLRKKIHSSDQEDQVSIFDSEQDQPARQQTNDNRDRGNRNRDKLDNKQKKTNARTRQKKLSRDEESIMKTILTEENNIRKPSKEQPTKEPSSKEPSNKETTYTHSHPSHSIPAVKHEQPPPPPKQSKNYLQLYDMKLQDCELKWFDLQQVSPKQPESSYNKRNARRRFGNPTIHYGRADNYQRTQYDYQVTYNQPYQYNYQPPYNRPNYTPTHNQTYRIPKYNSQNNNNSRINRYDDYPPYNYPSDKYTLNHTNHIISQLDDDQHAYSDGLSNEDLYEGIVGYNTTSEKEPQDQSTDVKAEEIREEKIKKEEVIQQDCRQRRNKILEQIQKLKEQFKKLEDEAQSQLPTNTQALHSSHQKQNQMDKQLWQFEPVPDPIKYPTVIRQPADNKYQKSKTDGRIAMIQLILKDNPFLTQFQMAEVLKAIDPFLNARIQRSVVLRLLKMSGYKKKKVVVLHKDRNNALYLDLRREFALKYKSLIKQKYQVAYYDELIINEYFDKESGWCKQADEVEMKPEKFITRSLTIIAILSLDGNCLWEARFGQICDIQFAKVLSKMLKNAGEGKDKKVLIANPLKYRRPIHFGEVASRRDWQLSVLPKHSLYLNPLQFYFAEVKDKLKRKKFQNLQSLFGGAAQAMQECEKQKTGVRVVSKIDMYIEKAVQKENF